MNDPAGLIQPTLHVPHLGLFSSLLLQQFTFLQHASERSPGNGQTQNGGFEERLESLSLLLQ